MKHINWLMILVITTVSACDDKPSKESAECVTHEDCGKCGRCVDGGCEFDEISEARPTCIDETEDPCNWLDDDGNGVIDDPDTCWNAVYRYVNDSGASCLGLNIDSPPVSCIEFSLSNTEPLFTIPVTNISDTVEARQCSRGEDHVIAVGDRNVEPPEEFETHFESIEAWEAIGYDCSLHLGYLPERDLNLLEGRVNVGEICQLYSALSVQDTFEPMGVHYYFLGHKDDLEGKMCQPPQVAYVFSKNSCPSEPPPACKLSPCPSQYIAGWVSQLVDDNTIVEPGEEFVQEWVFKNDGDVAWKADFAFVKTGGDLSSTNHVELGSPVAPGEMFTLSVEYTAPSSGVDFMELWEFRNPGTLDPIISFYFVFDVSSPHAAYLKLQDPPYATQMRSGSQFTQRFTIQNIGDTIWNRNWHLVNNSGTLSEIEEITLGEGIPPGGERIFDIMMETPAYSVGGFNDRWQLLTDNGSIVPFYDVDEEGILGQDYIEIISRVHVIDDNEALFVEETVEDKSDYPPGTPFLKTWTFQNAGSITWTEEWRVRHVEGELATRQSVNLTKTVEPGEEYTFSVPLRAPLEIGARYQDWWEFLTPDGEVVPTTTIIGEKKKIGGGDHWFYAEIDVIEPCEIHGSDE